MAWARARGSESSSPRVFERQMHLNAFCIEEALAALEQNNTLTSLVLSHNGIGQQHAARAARSPRRRAWRTAGGRHQRRQGLQCHRRLPRHPSRGCAAQLAADQQPSVHLRRWAGRDVKRECVTPLCDARGTSIKSDLLYTASSPLLPSPLLASLSLLGRPGITGRSRRSFCTTGSCRDRIVF